ncbi:MAG: ABC transporter ATP-binding protein [Acholeplasmatales bacterium]|nr:ABC transporter ATP-binding protein [Acholeplasmatales bacterium]
MSFISLKNVCREYELNKGSFKALNDITLDINLGEFLMILGPSGCGKSTLLNIIGGMDKPTSGEVLIDDKDIAKYTDKELTKYRRDSVGFIFQSYNLIGNLTVLENVMLSNDKVSEDEALKALEKLGILDKKDSFPSSMSGGEMQRVSIARAIIKSPRILLCDEPTGALDSKNGKEVMEILKEMNHNGQTIIMVTHNLDYKKYATRIISLKDGSLDRGDNVEESA